VIYAKKTDNSYVIGEIIPQVEYKFSVAAMDVAGNQSDKTNITFINDTSNTGVNIAGMHRLTIYPNPTSSFVFLSNEVRVNMQVFDVSGQLVISSCVNPGEKVDLSALHKGVYTVRIFEGDKLFVHKIIKQ
jgi:hypothetical protein